MYHFNCICGRDVKTEHKVGACPHCARRYDLRWPNDAPPAAAEQAETAKLVA